MTGKEITFGSLFAGVGGFDLGLRRAGMRAAFSCEIDDSATAVLTHHYPKTPHFSDVKDVTADVINAAGIQTPNLICGGFPCQDLSSSGHKKGLIGERSGLFFEAARIIKETNPDWIFLENVRGLLSSQKGRDMEAVLGTLGDLGFSVAYRVLDSQFFGVAQRRRRVYIVGHRGAGADPREVLFESERGRRNSTESDQIGPLHPPSNSRRPSSRVRGLSIWSIGLGSYPLWAEEIAQPLTRRCGDPTVITVGDSRVRRLMPIECERLQGFPDNWTQVNNAKGKPLADGIRYKQMGNACTVSVIEWIGRRIVSCHEMKGKL